MKQAVGIVLEVDGPVQPVTSTNKLKLRIGLLSAGSIVVLDFFIVLACLPAIEEMLGATKAQLQLILAAYAVANGSLLIVGGRLGDVFGRSRVMLWGIASFAISSLACGLSTGPWMLIAFRVAQGLSGALVQPQVLGLLSVNFDSEERNRVFGLYAASLGVAGIAAQLMGGLLVGLLPRDLGWRVCFIASVPLCVFAMVLASGAKDGPKSTTTKIDMVGACLLGVSLACICTFLTMGREQNWPGWSFSVLLLGLISGGALVRWQAIGKAINEARIVPGGILLENRFWVSLLTLFCFYSGVASLYFVLALHLRLHEGFGAVQVGLMFGWLAIFFVSTSTLKKYKKWVGKSWADVGLAALFVGHLTMLLASSMLSGHGQVIGYMISCALQGAGIGSLMGPLMAAALSKVNPRQASVGGGIASSMQQVGNSLGIAAVGFAYFGTAGSNASISGAVWYLCAVVLGLAAVVRIARD